MDVLVEFMDEHKIWTGLMMLLIWLLMLFYRIQKKESFKMKDHGVGSWEELVGYWTTLTGLIVCGIILIIKTI